MHIKFCKIFGGFKPSSVRAFGLRAPISSDSTKGLGLWVFGFWVFGVAFGVQSFSARFLCGLMVVLEDAWDVEEPKKLLQAGREGAE